MKFGNVPNRLYDIFVSLREYPYAVESEVYFLKHRSSKPHFAIDMWDGFLFGESWNSDFVLEGRSRLCSDDGCEDWGIMVSGPSTRPFTLGKLG